jgi:NAD(P)-dependent dehydrogenase (short-subunit alcohol dehydrogenase family)
MSAFELKDKVAIITAHRVVSVKPSPVCMPSKAQKLCSLVASKNHWMKSPLQLMLMVVPLSASPPTPAKKKPSTELVDKTVEHFGRVDILVNNAATNPHFGNVLEAEDSMWMKTFEVNLMGNVWLCQKVVPVMRETGGGKIINVASIVGLEPGAMQGVYSVTKAGVISLTKTLAMELGADNIQVNAIAPGLIKTKFAAALWSNEALLNQVEQRTPVGRIGQPDEIASMALYLASDTSNFTTGGVFVVDGGLTVGSI